MPLRHFTRFLMREDNPLQFSQPQSLHASTDSEPLFGKRPRSRHFNAQQSVDPRPRATFGEIGSCGALHALTRETETVGREFGWLRIIGNEAVSSTHGLHALIPLVWLKHYSHRANLAWSGHRCLQPVTLDRVGVVRLRMERSMCAMNDSD